MLDKGKAKIRPQGGEKVNRPLAGAKEGFQKGGCTKISFSF